MASVRAKLDTSECVLDQPPKIEDVSRSGGTDAVWVRRAARCVVDAPIVFRVAEEQDWLSGSTIDISQSGVLFTFPDETSFPSSLELQLVIYLSRANTAADGVPAPMPDLHCVGRVTRVGEPVDGRRAVAVRIDRGWTITSSSSAPQTAESPRVDQPEQ